MTNDERIEAAARVLCIHDWDALPEEADQMNGWGTVTAGKAFWRFKARKALSAAYPELHPPAGQQPTHWLAPWEASEDDEDVIAVARYEAIKANGGNGAAGRWVRQAWAAVRNAHLSK